MTLQDLTNLSTILASISLIVSAVFLFISLRDNNRLARANNTQSLVAMSSAFYLPLMQDPRMAELYLHLSQNARREELSPLDQFRLRTMVTWWLVFHENVFYQWKRGLLDEHTYRPWSADLKLFAQEQHLLSSWPVMKHLFSDEFANELETILGECRSRAAQE